MELAKALSISRREAIGAALEAWVWMTTMEHDGVVPDAVPDSIDGVVDIAGFGQAMLQARLVGVVNDGLVLPAELRQQPHDRSNGQAVVAPGLGDDARSERRREQNRVASRRYRRKTTVTGSRAKSSGGAANYRSLGHVAGHEVRVFEGQYGPYAMLLGATADGESCRLTTGSKAWSMGTVRLIDALPGLVKKWSEKSRLRKMGDANTKPTLVPSVDALREGADRLIALAKLEAAAEPRHADGDDASSRHADASAASAGPSAGPTAEGEQKSHGRKGFHAAEPSADRHADALSSMSFSSKSSSYEQEEDMGEEGRKAAADQQGVQGNAAEPEGMKEYDQKRAKKRAMAQKFAAALKEDIDTIWRLWEVNKPYLRSRLEAAGIDPNTGEARNSGAAAGGFRKPVDGPKSASGTSTACRSDRPPADCHDSPGASGESSAVWRQADDEVDGELSVARSRQAAISTA